MDGKSSQEFVIKQRKRSLPALEIFQKYFKCGKIFENKRRDNHTENLYRYCVRSKKDLHQSIVPFFNKNKLRTSKLKDFEKFKKILKYMDEGKHLNKKGLISVAKIIQTMNRKKASRFLESSETIR